MADKNLNSITFPGLPDKYKVAQVASEYSASSTYAEGDIVNYLGVTYRCTTAITTAEAWTAGHWTEVKVADEVTDLKSALNELPYIDRPWNLATGATGIEISENTTIQNNTSNPYQDSSNHFVVKNVPVDPDAPKTSNENIWFESYDGTGCRQVRKDSSKNVLSIGTNDTFKGLAVPDNVVYMDFAFKYKNSTTKEKGNYFATQTPSAQRTNYVDTLGAKVKQSDVEGLVDLTTAVNGKIDKAQSVNNKGLAMVVGNDGQVSPGYGTLKTENEWNIVDTGTLHENSSNDGSGISTSPVSSFFCVSGIPVQEGKTIFLNCDYYKNDTTRGARYVVFYNESDEVVSASSQGYKYYTVPDTAIKVDVTFTYSDGGYQTHDKGEYYVTYNPSDDRYETVDLGTAKIKNEDVVGASKNIDNSNTAVNTFGDIFPEELKESFYDSDKDMLIACVGDSITAAIDWCDIPEDVTHESPFGIRRCWTEMIAERARKIQLVYDRLDSERNNSNVITKTGTWTLVGVNNDDDIKIKESCIAARTFSSADSNAAVSFSFDTNSYEKCNIFWSMTPFGCKTVLSVSGGNGKLLASLDRETWVEANGFTHDQRSQYIRDGKSAEWLIANGIATFQRHRRLYLKKAVGVTGTVTVTYSRDNAETASNAKMYCWGIEKYSGNAVFFDNIGRGGHDISELAVYTSDIFDRNPDLVLYEMPLANDEAKSLSTVLTNYQNFFSSSDAYTYKTQSNNYTNVYTIMFMPHMRGTSFDGNVAIFDSSLQVSADPVAYIYYRKVYKLMQEIFADYQKTEIINLCERMLNEAEGQKMTYEYAFNGNMGSVGKAYTFDDVHLNQNGANKYVKYLLPIFQY